jgi:hypothetical protein
MSWEIHLREVITSLKAGKDSIKEGFCLPNMRSMCQDATAKDEPQKVT